MSENVASELRRRLAAVLDEGVAPVTAAEARSRAEIGSVRAPARWRPSRPRSAIWHAGPLAALVTAVVALIGVVAVVAVRHAPPTSRSPRTMVSPARRGLPSTPDGPCAGQPTGCGSPESSAQALSHGRWVTFPSGPLTARTGQVEVWTGRELIVWGGSTDDGAVPLGDGAAYDPSTKTWRMLPPSPLPAVSHAAAVWTGTEMVVLGGEVAGNHPTARVAAYVPASDTWHVLAPLPAGPATGLDAIWTGRRVVVLGSDTSFRLGRGGAQVFSLDPATDTWARLAPLPPATPARSNWRPLAVAGAWTGSGLEAFVTWQRSGPCGKNCGYVGESEAAWLLPAGSSSWRRLPPPPVQLGGAVTAWTGRGVIVAGGEYCPWGCPPPVPLAAFEAASSHRWSRALGQEAVTAWPGVWTGKAFVTVVRAGHGFGPQWLGAWDPARAAWVRLPALPAVLEGQGASSPVIWTGTELLAWGSQSFAFVVP